MNETNENIKVSKRPVGKTALVAVDCQTDFISGTLAVPNGAEVIDPIIKLADEVDFVFATADWHPADHCSFTENGGEWPTHCVAPAKEPATMEEALEDNGSDINPLIQKRADFIIRKGTDKDVEAYSAFSGTTLAEQLRELGVTDLLVTGLATDYCVKATAIDALEEEFKVTVVENACRGVNVKRGDDKKALAEMRTAGAVIRSDRD